LDLASPLWEASPTCKRSTSTSSRSRKSSSIRKIRSRIKREWLHEIHENKIREIDRLSKANEKNHGIAEYRKMLLSFADGLILETAVGTSNNIPYYPQDKPVAVIGVDYSQNALDLAIYKDDKGLDINYKIEDLDRLHD
jgi:hypothetical protein